MGPFRVTGNEFSLTGEWYTVPARSSTPTDGGRKERRVPVRHTGRGNAVLWIAALACCLAALTGCGNPGQSADDSSSAPKDTKIDPASFKGKTLTYVYFTDGPDEQATRSLIGKFEGETGAKVNLQILPFDELQNSLQARLSGGN